MQHSEAQYTVESLLHAHRIAVEQVQVLCRSAGRHWIHQQSWVALVLIYKQALQKLTNMLTDLLLSQDLHAQDLQLFVQPALDMVLDAIQQGERFLDEQAGLSLEYTWLHMAILQGHATDAIDVHLHDFLIAFSAVGAAIEDLNASITKGSMTQHSADLEPSPDLFWKEQNRPHVLLVAGQHLDKAKHLHDSALNSQLEHAMNLTGYPNDVDTLQPADDEDRQLAVFAKQKIVWATQAFHEDIIFCFLGINTIKILHPIMKSFHTNIHVYMVNWLGREYALKSYGEDTEYEFRYEANLHVRLHHPNVVHAAALFQGQKEYGILIELMDGDLKRFLERHAFKLTLKEKVRIMLQIAKGMAYVHERGVIHRDLKPSNVLVRRSMDTQASKILQLEVKIADFGVSRVRGPDSSSFATKRVGTTVYRAPEVLNRSTSSSYKRSADVYSFAMTCFELLAEKEPFKDSEKNEALWERVRKGERPDLSDVACPPYLKHCLKTWWAGDPEIRHSFTHICCILRHLYVCLARCQKDTKPIVQFPFLAWPFWRWSRAQDIAQERMEQFEKRRANEDWKEKGYLCESTRVNEIPYELHVMKWAIKKAAQEGIVEVPTTAPSSKPRKSFGQKLKEFCCCSALIQEIESSYQEFVTTRLDP